MVLAASQIHSILLYLSSYLPPMCVRKGTFHYKWICPLIIEQYVINIFQVTETLSLHPPHADYLGVIQECAKWLFRPLW